MMASQSSKVHDPMYNFDTHFPERLSRLHLHGDFNSSGSFRRKKSRAQRNGARYKTQPVTFDEIKEVDEEPAATASDEKGGQENLMGQLQAFSRSMDGLLPKSALPEHMQAQQVFQPHFSHSRSGSRKFQRHPECIPEQTEQQQQSEGKGDDDGGGGGSGGGGGDVAGAGEKKEPQPEERLQSAPTSRPNLSEVETSATTSALNLPSASGAAAGDGLSPIPSPNIAPRRQKITAKAKKRQKALEDAEAGKAS